MSFIADIIEKVKEKLPLKDASKSVADGVIGIDIGASSIKVVQLRKRGGRVVLDAYGNLALGPYIQKQVGELVPLDPEVLGPAILDVLKESKTTAKVAAVSIRGSASLIFVLSLPTTSAKELSNMVVTEARKYIPVPITDVSLDWWVIPTPPTNTQGDDKQKSDVLVAALRNEKLAAYRTLIDGSPLTPLLYEIETFSMMRSTFENELASVALVDFGAASTRIAIVHYGVIKRFHIIKRGSHHLTEMIAQALGEDFAHAESLKKSVGLGGVSEREQQVSSILKEALLYIVAETKGVILRYEKEYHKAVAKMIITGGGARMPGFTQFLGDEFGGEIQFADPFSRVHTEELLRDVLRVAGPEFATAVGLALKSLED